MEIIYADLVQASPLFTMSPVPISVQAVHGLVDGLSLVGWSYLEGIKDWGWGLWIYVLMDLWIAPQM